MWFKNLIVFQFNESVEWDDQVLQQCLEKDAFKRCGPQQASSMGWVPPMGNQAESLAHGALGIFLLTAKREERILPAGAVKDAMEEKVKEIESREERKVGRKQKKEIREDMIFAMMPRAFTRSSLLQGLIMPEQGLIVIDSANRNRAEEWISLLRASLGVGSIQPVETRKSVSGLATSWLSGDAPFPAGIEPGDECELQSSLEKRSVVICRRQDLEGDEIRSHLKSGKQVVRMAIEWKQSISFIINEALELKKLRFSDVTVEQADGGNSMDVAAEFDTRFTMMALELSRLLPALWEIFGGLEEGES